MSTQHQDEVATIEREKIKEPSKYNVIIHDNDITSYEEVIFIISRCFEKSETEAMDIARKVDTDGRGVCGTYTKEVADAKLEMVDMAKMYLMQNFPHRVEAITALKFSIEEA